MRLTFVGGAGTVTGANFLLDDPPGRQTGLPAGQAGGAHKYLVDCGLLQGCAYCEPRNYDPFPYDPASIDALFVTHAHIDHIGRIPKLVRDGFRGVIYSTEATRDLAGAMLADTLNILTLEARAANRPVLYHRADIDAALSLWKSIPYGEVRELENGLSAELIDAGHILGSAMVRFRREARSILFSGDIGNHHAALLPEAAAPTEATYLVMESVYGDRSHDTSVPRRERLAHAIVAGADRGGTILIPAFSMERTQDLLFDLRELMEEGRIPRIPIFVDSPLAAAVTPIFERHRALMRRDVASRKGPLFSFPGLTVVHDHEASANIRHTPSPKVIIAGSGMSHGGRVVAHEAALLPQRENTLLMVGYQAAGSLGRLLEEGMKRVSIFGRDVRVHAHVERITGYSGHRDRNGLLEFVEPLTPTLEKVFVVMGEPGASLHLAQRLHDYLGVRAQVPERGEAVEIRL